MKLLDIIIYITLPQAFLFMIYGVVMSVLENVYLFYFGFALIVFYLFVYFRYLVKLVQKMVKK